MSNSKDSGLLDSTPFGDENGRSGGSPYDGSRYESSKRQNEDFDPFAQPLPPSAEPLFPATDQSKAQGNVQSQDRPSDQPVDFSFPYSTGYLNESQAGYPSDQNAGYGVDPLARYTNEYNNYQGNAPANVPTNIPANNHGNAYPNGSSLSDANAFPSDPLARFASEYASESGGYESDPHSDYVSDPNAGDMGAYTGYNPANNAADTTANTTGSDAGNSLVDPLTRYANDHPAPYSTNYSPDYPSNYSTDYTGGYPSAPASEPLWSAPSWTEAVPDGMTYQQSPSSQKYSPQSYDQLFGTPEPFVEQEIAPALTAAPVANDPAPLSLPSEPAPATAMTALLEEPAPQPKEEQAAANQKPALDERDALFNRHFAVLMDLMQHGAWPQAVAKIEAMKAEFPTVKGLDNLYHEATLKAQLMSEWTPKIKGRRLTVSQEFLIRRSLPFLFLFLLFVSGTTFYRIFLAPSREVMAMERANQALVDEAAGLVQNGQIDEAIELYNTVLSRNPNNSQAQQGLVTAAQQTGLSVIYDVAIRVANSGNLERSFLMLQSVKAKSANFRDIDARLSRVNSLLSAEHAYKLAEKAFAERRWVDAVTNYEQTRELAPDYQELRVASQLSAAYFYGAQKVMAEWPSDEFGPEQIRDFLRKAQEVNGQDQTLSGALDDISDLLRGARSMNNNDFDQAIKVWRQLFDKRPGLLGGYFAEELYRAYLTLAGEMSARDKAQAQELYTLAASLPVSDSSEARTQLQGLGAPLPPVQPTLMPQPTVSLDPSSPVASAAPSAPDAEATPTPELAVQTAAKPPTTAANQPTSTPSAYQGWIAFRTTRDGALQIYMMRGDGSEQKPAPEDVRVRLDAFYQDQQRSPDGRKLTIQPAGGRSDSNIVVTNLDGSQNTLADTTGNESDAVWSGFGDHIAFVTNQTGNDEIWIMRGDGSGQEQLTSNSWEWDKHPTWSPDSSQIAFFSNRSGQRQIWVMNSDGSGQHNISNNSFEDWDPVWLK